MNTYNNPIHTRVMGYLPLSIATALAFQEFLGYIVNDDQELIEKDKAPIHLKYQDVWINMSTLYRNFIGSLGAIEYGKIDGALLINEIYQEAERIKLVINDHNPALKVSFYHCDYLDNEKRYPNAFLRKAKTDKQLEYLDVRTKVFEKLLPALEENSNINYHYFKNQIMPVKEVPRKTVMLTHVPLDLLAQYYFGELNLIESHTGTIKSKPLWYTKYHNGKDLVKIPFLESLLQIFGDSETFSPQAIKYRRFLLELADKNNWSNITTRDRIKANINYSGNEEMKTELIKFLN